MDKLVIGFVLLVTMLFLGITIMMSPTKIASLLTGKSNGATLGALMTLASILFVIGLLGIAVMGFLVSKDQTEKEMHS